MKTRSDSLWAQLKPAQRDELMGLFDSGKSYADGVSLCAQWGVKTSAGALSRLYTVQGFSWRLERAKAAAEATRAALPRNFEFQQKELVAQKIFELVARGDADPKAIIAVRKLELEAERLDLAERRVSLLEAKLREGKEVMSDTKLTEAERSQKLKEIFGMA